MYNDIGRKFNMYDNIGKKLKTIAMWTAIIGSVFGVIYGISIVVLNPEFVFLGTIVILFCPLISWASSCSIYGLGETIDRLGEIERNTRTGNQKNKKNRQRNKSYSSYTYDEDFHNEKVHNEEIRNDEVHNGEVCNDELHNEKARDEKARDEKSSMDAFAVPYVECPVCGAKHDFIYPRCPKCNYKYDDKKQY